MCISYAFNQIHTYTYNLTLPNNISIIPSRYIISLSSELPRLCSLENQASTQEGQLHSCPTPDLTPSYTYQCASSLLHFYLSPVNLTPSISLSLQTKAPRSPTAAIWLRAWPSLPSTETRALHPEPLPPRSTHHAAALSSSLKANCTGHYPLTTNE